MCYGERDSSLPDSYVGVYRRWGNIMRKQKRNGKNGGNSNGRRASLSRQRRQRQLIRRAVTVLGCAFFLTVAALTVCRKIFDSTGQKNPAREQLTENDWIGAPDLNVDLIEPNEYSRPGTPLTQIKGVVIHYTANPGTGAKANRDYFEGLKDTHTTKASSHFVVGLEGEIIQCIPSTEISYASNERNKDTLSIECCHPDDTGQFQENTYRSMVSLTGWLCSRFGLTSQDVIRHYDVTGKICPKYFVEHEEAWAQFKADVDAKIEKINAMK